VCLTLLCVWLVSFSFAVTFYCRYLARMLMKTLAGGEHWVKVIERSNGEKGAV
jgi:hypothetical protein